jgi:hypothetical protein
MKVLRKSKKVLTHFSIYAIAESTGWKRTAPFRKEKTVRTGLTIDEAIHEIVRLASGEGHQHAVVGGGIRFSYSDRNGVLIFHVESHAILPWQNVATIKMDATRLFGGRDVLRAKLKSAADWIAVTSSA